MIRIQFDHQAFTMQRYGGISRYFANIQNYLDHYEGFSYNRGVLFTHNHYLEGADMPTIGLPAKKWVKKERKIYKLNKEYSKYHIKNGDYDIFHPTYYDPYFLDIIKKPFVITVHDLIHELFPEYFYYDPTIKNKRLLIEKASHFIAISESTRNDLQRIYNIPDDKVTTVYHGFNAKEVVYNRAAVNFNNYILFVGDRAHYKNFFKWLEAVAPLLIKYGLTAVCAGGPAFNIAEQEFIRRLGVEDKISQQRVSEELLGNLYHYALFFVYPSLYEGFGFPILEAFANNCPVLVSDTSCFKEVGGEASLYFDPYDISSMQSVMEGMIINKEQLDKLRIAGKARLAKFTMQNCMEQTLQVYRQLAGK